MSQPIDTSGFKSGAAVVNAHPQPPYGPLTSTEHLLPGDLVRVIRESGRFGIGKILPVIRKTRDPNYIYIDRHAPSPQSGSWTKDNFAFIGRPDKDGWITAPDGGWPENPCPGYRVEYRLRNGISNLTHLSDKLRWGDSDPSISLYANDITAIKILGLEAGDVEEAQPGVFTGPTYSIKRDGERWSIADDPKESAVFGDDRGVNLQPKQHTDPLQAAADDVRRINQEAIDVIKRAKALGLKVDNMLSPHPKITKQY